MVSGLITCATTPHSHTLPRASRYLESISGMAIIATLGISLTESTSRNRATTPLQTRPANRTATRSVQLAITYPSQPMSNNSGVAQSDNRHSTAARSVRLRNAHAKGPRFEATPVGPGAYQSCYNAWVRLGPRTSHQHRSCIGIRSTSRIR